MRTAVGDDGRPLGTVALRALFDRLDVLHVLLSENADRWSVSTGGEVVERILAERVALHDECLAVERELRTRTVVSGGAGDVPAAAAHTKRRARANQAAAAAHAGAAAVHERAAAVHRAADRQELADKERSLAAQSLLRERRALARARSIGLDRPLGTGGSTEAGDGSR